MPLSQAQIDQLDVILAQLTRWRGGLVADAPTPPIPPTGSLGLYSEHNAAYFGAHHYPMVLVDSSGNPTGGSAGTYASLAAPPGKGIVVWGPSGVEHHAIVSAPTGEQWAILEAYATADGTQYFPQQTIKCEWINLQTNVTRDISRVTPTGPTGTPMCIQQLVAGKYRLRLWAYACARDGTPSFPYYWQADYEFGRSLPNPAWTGDAQKTRQVFILSEAWWDLPNSNGWTDRGHGTGPAPWVGADGSPWTAQGGVGNPVPVDPGPITFTGWQAFARGAGAMWVYQYPNFRAAVTSVA